MKPAVPRGQQADLRRIRAARVALGWVLLFLAMHVYWYLGGSFASPGKLPGRPHSLFGWTFNVLVDGAFVLGLLVPLTIARGEADGRLAKPVAILLRLGAVVLVLRGAAGVVDDLTRATGLLSNGITGLSTKQTTATAHLTWSGWVIDGYFLIGGMIFTWLAIRHRQHAANDNSLSSVSDGLRTGAARSEAETPARDAVTMARCGSSSSTPRR